MGIIKTEEKEQQQQRKKTRKKGYKLDWKAMIEMPNYMRESYYINAIMHKIFCYFSLF